MYLCKIHISSIEQEITCFLLRCDDTFKALLRGYIDKGVEKDLSAANKGEATLPEYQKMMESAASALSR